MNPEQVPVQLPPAETKAPEERDDLKRMALIQRDMISRLVDENTDGMAAMDIWVNSYAEEFRKLARKEPEILDRYEAVRRQADKAKTEEEKKVVMEAFLEPIVRRLTH